MALRGLLLWRFLSWSRALGVQPAVVCGAPAPEPTVGRRGARGPELGSVVAAHKLSRLVARGVLLDRGSNFPSEAPERPSPVLSLIMLLYVSVWGRTKRCAGTLKRANAAAAGR